MSHPVQSIAVLRFIQRNKERPFLLLHYVLHYANCRSYLGLLEGAQSTIVLSPLRVSESKGRKGQKEKARTGPLHQLTCTSTVFFLFFFFVGRKHFDFRSLSDIGCTESPVLCICVLPPFAVGEQADKLRFESNQAKKKKKKKDSNLGLRWREERFSPSQERQLTVCFL